MEKLKNVRLILIGFILYILIGVAGYFLIKNVYKPSIGSNDTYVRNSIEIEDEMDLVDRLANRESTYALIYGEFKSVDSITDKFLNGTFSYIDEIKVDSRGEKEIRESNKKCSNEYSMNGITIKGINFDKIEPEKFRIVNDIRNTKVVYEYYVKKESYTGTMLCYIDYGEIGIIDFYKNQTISSVRDIYDNEVVFTEHAFLILWLLFLFLILIGIDNLNENPDDFKVDVRR